jgi:hypothetical protein
MGAVGLIRIVKYYPNLGLGSTAVDVTDGSVQLGADLDEPPVELDGAWHAYRLVAVTGRGAPLLRPAPEEQVTPARRAPPARSRGSERFARTHPPSLHLADLSPEPLDWGEDFDEWREPASADEPPSPIASVANTDCVVDLRLRCAGAERPRHGGPARLYMSDATGLYTILTAFGPRAEQLVLGATASASYHVTGLRVIAAHPDLERPAIPVFAVTHETRLLRCPPDDQIPQVDPPVRATRDELYAVTPRTRVSMTLYVGGQQDRDEYDGFPVVTCCDERGCALRVAAPPARPPFVTALQADRVYDLHGFLVHHRLGLPQLVWVPDSRMALVPEDAPRARLLFGALSRALTLGTYTVYPTVHGGDVDYSLQPLIDAAADADLQGAIVGFEALVVDAAAEDDQSIVVKCEDVTGYVRLSMSEPCWRKLHQGPGGPGLERVVRAVIGQPFAFCVHVSWPGRYSDPLPVASARGLGLSGDWAELLRKLRAADLPPDDLLAPDLDDA